MRKTFFRTNTIDPTRRPDRGGAVVAPISDISRALQQGRSLGSVPVEYSENDPLNAPYMEMESFKLDTHERSFDAVRGKNEMQVDYLIDSLNAVTNEDYETDTESDSSRE